MIYLYSIIEGLFFTDFFSHSQLRFNQLSKYYLLFFYAFYLRFYHLSFTLSALRSKW